MLFSELANFFAVFFRKIALIHPISIVLIAKTAQNLQFPVASKHSYRRMCDTIERVGLHRRVVYHVLEYHFFAHLQFVIKAPVAHKIATQTTVATKSISKWRVLPVHVLSIAYIWVVWHLQAVGHVTGEAHIQDSRPYALVLYDVHHTGHQRSRLPGKVRLRS